MKNVYAYLSLWALLFAFNLLQAQEKETLVIDQQKELVIQEERSALKNEVEKINKRLENNEITSEEANTLKQFAAQKHALNIENRIAILENEFALSQRNKTVISYDNEKNSISIIDEGKILSIKFRKKRPFDRRTTSDFVFAFGFNNALTKGESLEDSDFKIGGSRFAELGWAWKTRVFKNTNWLRVKYGFSFQFNGLKPTGNRVFVDEGDETSLQEFPFNLKKSKFRYDNLVFPVHFEIGSSKKKEYEDYFRYSTKNHFKFGIGGYAGFNLSTRQKLKFTQEGNKRKVKSKEDFNTNNLVYGLSTYLGWSNVGLYAKYDLNTIFNNNPLEQRTISLGVRFDMD
ncbi:MAG: hypothetical protein CVU03_05975 [Bacteroidetes bacterium HGW-Bacteroidetes-2]|nr:MAG: hypothetical protein CVU03_05975 [Bacteroidetes bacterium HGW-Bacteroidetes-2]